MASFMNMITALLALLSTPASARHIHRRSSHKHARQLVVPNVVPVVAVSPPTSPTPSASLPAITAGNAAIEDIQDIQEGLSDLPQNLLAFIQAVSDRLEEVEGVLQGLVSSSTLPTLPASGDVAHDLTAVTYADHERRKLGSIKLDSIIQLFEHGTVSINQRYLASSAIYFVISIVRFRYHIYYKIDIDEDPYQHEHNTRATGDWYGCTISADEWHDDHIYLYDTGGYRGSLPNHTAPRLHFRDKIESRCHSGGCLGETMKEQHVEDSTVIQNYIPP
ncbi:hypothetical protein CLAFUW4_04549 [Fulvia fulva]|uniref:Uncharacterized protein n=1 Tax=Passalora fulva TaxID=5499 RepID=A0A9Q8LFN5_PASFU|nr:uncharacterized protein CLAFUR5_04511 [Fulvia fulva]KAK4627071.1 hypothetical protein CLAFUR4_04535 [Fulvia fulva]UJO16556.1 hypothetical protein CLAFUR5_04511 [Fulvia fulva]WPV13289.1 hypothetical protein CLAFUW4_04549 [Fulvia fulva]WPV28505.1 hypothetical protein CLAFUW7_04541 [Fulvia fulva]